MERHEILDMLARTGAIVEGHFPADTGRAHTDMAVRTAKVLQFAPLNRKLAFEIVRHFLELDIHVVVAVSTGAIPIAVEVGRQLEARTIFIEETDGRAGLFRGFGLYHGERVVLIQDYLRTQRELIPALGLIRDADARLIGVGSVIDGREEIATHTYKNVTALRHRPNQYAPEECPLCAAGVPLVDPDTLPPESPTAE